MAAPVEVEAKLPLGDPAAARRRLLACGAVARGGHVEEDLFFLHPARDLAAADEALRLRRTPAGLELTYKGPRSGRGGVKARTELTVPVGADPGPLLAALGFRPGPQVRKHREAFTLDGLTVTLDEVERVGWFAEVEAMATDAAEGARKVEELLAKLGWESWPREARPYIALVLAARSTSG
ncbi:MAG: adenylate cyclase, class 2 [Thermoplasmata archaeon]|nr:adenylate cyclase, class 2 [Thermoplasmata archaeon]